MTHLPRGVRLAVSPLSWTNDVLADLGGDIPLETCLDDAAANGFQGVELGRKFPRQAAALRPLLQARGLALASGWHSGFLAARSVAEEMAAVQDHAALLQAMGCGVMVYGPVGRMAPGAPLDLPMSRRLRLDAGEARDYADRLAAFDRQLQDRHGLRLAYHHHLMMVAETFDEVSRLIDRARCGLLVDTGHAVAAGFDPALLFDRFGDLVTHIHLKDVRADRLAQVRAGDLSFNAAVRAGMFTVPGDGCVDFFAVSRFVRRTGWQGWLVIEAEQDPARPEAEPKSATRRGFHHISTLFAEA